jgi:hypothetical protein
MSSMVIRLADRISQGLHLNLEPRELCAEVCSCVQSVQNERGHLSVTPAYDDSAQASAKVMSSAPSVVKFTVYGHQDTFETEDLG